MTTKRTLYPYTIIDNVDLRVKNLVEARDGTPLDRCVFSPEDALGQRRVDVVDAIPSWTAIQMDVEFEIAEDDLATIVPEPATVHDETMALVSVRCASTKYRRGIPLRALPGRTWRGMVEFARDDVAGLVELVPSLVRTKDDTDPDSESFADFAGALIAFGPAVQIVVDRAARPYDGTFEYIWENFPTSSNPWRAAHKDDVYHLEAADVPKLYLNLRWGFLKPVLDFEGKFGANAAMRNMAASTIGVGAWMQLFAMAVGSILTDGESFSIGGEAWRKDLVRTVLAQVYPDTPETDRLRLAHDEWRDPASLATLVSKMGSIVQTRSTSGKLMDLAVRAIESVPQASTEGR